MNDVLEAQVELAPGRVGEGADGILSEPALCDAVEFVRCRNAVRQVPAAGRKRLAGDRARVPAIAGAELSQVLAVPVTNVFPTINLLALCLCDTRRARKENFQCHLT